MYLNCGVNDVDNRICVGLKHINNCLLPADEQLHLIVRTDIQILPNRAWGLMLWKILLQAVATFWNLTLPSKLDCPKMHAPRALLLELAHMGLNGSEGAIGGVNSAKLTSEAKVGSGKTHFLIELQPSTSTPEIRASRRLMFSSNRKLFCKFCEMARWACARNLLFCRWDMYSKRPQIKKRCWLWKEHSFLACRIVKTQ